MTWYECSHTQVVHIYYRRTYNIVVVKPFIVGFPDFPTEYLIWQIKCFIFVLNHCITSSSHRTGGCVNGREGGGRQLEIFHICVNWALSVWWLCRCALPGACKMLLSHNNIIWRMGPDGRYKVRNPLLSNLHLLVWFAILVADSLLTFNIHFIYSLLIIAPFVFVINISS